LVAISALTSERSANKTVHPLFWGNWRGLTELRNRLRFLPELDVEVVLPRGDDSGAVTQNYAAGASLTLSVQTAATGCTTAPADANAVIQYKMQ